MRANKYRLRKAGASLWILLLLVLFLLVGCGKGQSAEEYLQERMEAFQAGDDELANALLDLEIQEADGDYVLQFPEELREDYLSFLKKACSNIKYKIVDSKSFQDGSKITLELWPVDVESAVSSQDAVYLQQLASTDLTTAVKEILEQDTALLGQAKQGRKQKLVLRVEETDSGYQIEDASMQELAENILEGPMKPYKDVAELLDIRDYLEAFLNASYKGDVARYAEHTGQEQSVALEKYEESFSAEGLSDLALNDEQQSRFTNAMKTIFANSSYEIGQIRSGAQGGYVLDVTLKSNLSLQKSRQEFENKASGGRYSTSAQLAEAYISILEKYAANPVYGEQTSMELQLDEGALSVSGSSDEKLDAFLEMILPS